MRKSLYRLVQVREGLIRASAQSILRGIAATGAAALVGLDFSRQVYVPPVPVGGFVVPPVPGPGVSPGS